ncbi:thiol peroxidase [Pandoraea sp. NPDC090278]|uniref:thiol peroxidase n=1 Tax=Pandoraea sp. NPDC090278 TaxID=3364391 RepID=UPI00383BC77E
MRPNFLAYFGVAISAIVGVTPAFSAESQQVTFQGSPVKIMGKFLSVGEKAPDFKLVDGDLNEVTLSKWHGKRKILNIFVSSDTPVCDASIRKFNETASNLKNTVIIGISSDLPFAQKRFCSANGINNVYMLSDFRSPSFGRDYGVMISDGPLRELLTRAVVVLDENDRVIYRQMVSEITQEPDYQKVIDSLK